MTCPFEIAYFQGLFSVSFREGKWDPFWGGSNLMQYLQHVMGIFEGILMFFSLCMKFGLQYNFLTPDKMQVFFEFPY